MLPPPCFVCFHSFWSFGRKGGVSLLQSDVGKHPPISGSFSLDRPNAYKRGCPALSNTFPFQNKNLEQKLVIRRKDLWLQGNIQACLWQRTESCQVSIRRRKSCLLCLYRVLHFWQWSSHLELHKQSFNVRTWRPSPSCKKLLRLQAYKGMTATQFACSFCFDLINDLF